MSTKETTKQAEHTALPWRVHGGSIYAGPEGYGPVDGWACIARMDRERGNGTLPVERDANAALIVRAVNAHNDLLEAVRGIHGLACIAAGPFMPDIKRICETALAKAEVAV